MFVPGFAALALFPMMSRLYINSQKDLATLYTNIDQSDYFDRFAYLCGTLVDCPKTHLSHLWRGFCRISANATLLRLTAIASFPEKLHGNIANLLRSPSREHQEPMDSRLRECRRKCDFNS